jgi:type IV secretory pathway protease TraF
MRNRIMLLMALAVQLAAVRVAVAQQSPAGDLSGTWVVNVGKSSFSPMTAPTVDSIVVTRADDSYQFDATSDFGGQGKQHLVYKWPIGAGEVTNNINGAIVHTTIAVKGDTLLPTSQITMQGETVATQKGRVFRSADGKTLTRDVVVQPASSMSGDPIHIVFVYDRR